MNIEKYKLVYNPKKDDIEEILNWLKSERDYINYGLGFYNNKNVIIDALNQNRVFTLKINDKNIGLVVWSDIEDEIVDIDIFTVHPNFRNQGVGRELYNSIYRYFEGLNYKVLKLYCEPKESESFWKKMGLEKISDDIRGIHELSYYKILVKTASTKPIINSEKIELWNVDFTEVEGKYPIKTWYVKSNEYHLTKPLIYPCNYDWYLRWTKNGEIIFENELICITDYDDKFYRRPFLIITDLIDEC